MNGKGRGGDLREGTSHVQLVPADMEMRVSPGVESFIGGHLFDDLQPTMIIFAIAENPPT